MIQLKFATMFPLAHKIFIHKRLTQNLSNQILFHEVLNNNKFCDFNFGLIKSKHIGYQQTVSFLASQILGPQLSNHNLKMFNFLANFISKFFKNIEQNVTFKALSESR